MRRTFFIVLGVAFCVHLFSQSWLPLKEQVAQCDILSRSGVVVLLDSAGVVVDHQGSGAFRLRKVIMVQDRAGALAHRLLKYDYDPLTAFAEFSRVTIYRADGTVDTVKVTKSCDYPAPARAIYWGARQIMIEVGTLSAGDIIDYEIEKRGFTYALLAGGDDDERFVPPMRGHFYDIVPFWVTYPTLLKVYHLNVPKEKDMQYEFYQGGCRSSERIVGDRRVFTFAMDRAMPFKSEPNMADLFDVAPKLFISSTLDWKEKSRWFYQVNEDYGSFDAMPEAQKKVDEIIKGKKHEMDIIGALTHWVADNMRYSGISMGEGEGFTLHNTKMNFTDRCGVCKDKAALLISMLRMAGFEAYAAMTMAGSRVETIPADHFNHSVVVVKLSNGQLIPLDPTWVPFVRELWSSAEQQQHFLPGLPEGSDLCLTPVSPAKDHYFKVHAKTALDATGMLRGSFTLQAEGQSDAAVRRLFTSGMQEGWQNAMEHELLVVNPQAKMTRVDYGKDPRDYMEGPIKITMHFEIPDYALVADKLMICPAICSRLFTRAMSHLRINTSLAVRQYAFKDACSRYVELTEEMTLPTGYKLQQAPVSEGFHSEVADFVGGLKQDGHKIQVSHQLTLRKRVYEAMDWDDFRTAVNKHKAIADEQLVLKRK